MHRIIIGFMLIAFLAACGNSRTDEVSVPPVPSTDDKLPAPAADDRPIILAFGDSLTAGSGLPPGSGYPEILQAELDSRGYKYHVVNAGIGGDTTSDGLVRVERAVALHPEIVILELGGNDGLRGIPVESMQSNLEKLILAFQNGGSRVILAGMTLPRNYGAEYIGTFEKVYAALATKHKVTLIPFFLEGAAGNPELNVDEIHPNEAGYKIVTANVLKYLEPMLTK